MFAEIAACSHCGSRRIGPAPKDPPQVLRSPTSRRNRAVATAALAMGIVAPVTLPFGPTGPSYRCEACGKAGILLLFRTEEERARFAAECLEAPRSKG